MHKLLLFLLCIPITSRLVGCAPIPDAEPSFVSGPSERGTIQLLWSCTMTFVLCIWTAMHPNVVPWNSFWDHLFHKLTWLGFSVLMPEMVVCAAAGQLLQANDIQTEWRKQIENHSTKNQPTGDQSTEDQSTEDQSTVDMAKVKEWLGMSGAFFVVMGGFVIEGEHRTTRSTTQNTTPIEAPQDDPPESVEHLLGKPSKWVTTVRPEGFKVLLKDIIPTLIKERKLTEAHFQCENIKDKGKASGLAKCLVIFQIVWMGVQCLARTTSGLPLSLLEGHVLIQLPFAIIAYTCWWYKPLDVSEPIHLTLELKHIQSIFGRIKKDMEQHGFKSHYTTEKRGHGGLWQMALFAVVMALVNGGLHAVAWNAHFPTSVERQLWRIAAIGTGLLPIITLWATWLTDFQPRVVKVALCERHNKTEWLGIWNFFARVLDVVKDIVKNPVVSAPEQNRVQTWRHSIPMWARYLMSLLLCYSLLGYVLCVAYLTAESFVSTRSLPKGGYAKVQWSDYFPHL